MRVPWVKIDGRPYIDVMGLELVLRDAAAILEQQDEWDEAAGLRRVIAVLTATVRQEDRVQV